MPFIRIYGLPYEINHESAQSPFISLQGEHATERLRSFRENLQQAVSAIEPLHISRDQVTISLPLEVAPSSPREIIVFVDGLYRTPERCRCVRVKLAEAIRDVVINFTKDAGLNWHLIEIFVSSFSSNSDVCLTEKRISPCA